MPFTPSHIVAVLPVAKCCRQFPFSALAIGSMIPDLPLFFPVLDYWQTHDFSRVLTTCLPLGLAAFVVFHLFLKMPLVSLSPGFVHHRMARRASAKLEISPRYWFLVVMAIVIGAYSHVLWDSFTHADRWGTQTFPALNRVVTVAGRNIAVFKLLQHASSVGGLLVLAVVVLGMLSDQKSGERPLRCEAHPTVKCLAALSLVALPFLSFLYVMQFDYSLTDVIGLTIRLSGALLVTALAAYSLVFHLVTGYQFVEP